MSKALQIISKSCGHEVRPGEFIMLKPDYLLGHDAGIAPAIPILNELGGDLYDPSRIIVVMDHFVPAPSEEIAKYHKSIRAWIGKKGINNFFEVGCGVCHQVLLDEGFAAPGKIIAGADSHTPTCGAVGALGIAIGVTELAVAMTTGEIWIMVPDTIYFNLHGVLPSGSTAKDLALHIIKSIKDLSIQVNYKSVEFIGAGLNTLSVGDRATLCNMMAEAGVKTALISPDEGDIAGSYDICLDDISPLVAVPYSPENVESVSEVDVSIDQAYLGSCTNGRIEDLRTAATILEGKKIHPDVRMLVSPASNKVFRQAVNEGLVDVLADAGAMFIGCACGACFGAHMGLLAEGGRCISSTNRNFPARMGHAKSEVYLASPATVAASAITGKITDPRGFV